LWSHAYDIDSHDLIGVQQKIAQSIADDMYLGRGQSAADGGRARRFTSDPAAHDLYLRGMEALNASGAESFGKAAGFFQAAVDKDPNFAMAWLGLARAHDSMASELAPGVSYEQVGAEARRALDLDPSLAEAHETLAIIAWERDHDWASAEREFRLAVAGNGSASARSHAVYAFHLAERGRFAESHVNLRTAQDLSPLEVLPYINEAWVFFYEHRYDQAERVFKRILEIHPDDAMALEGLGHMKTMLGDCQAGGEYAAKLSQLWPKSALTQSVLWNLMVCQGDVVRARKLLDNAAPKISPFYAAASYAVLGDKEQAIAYLEQAVTKRDILATSMGVNPYLDRLHSDPRFTALERRVGLNPDAH
jgi:serine/threonine-protein kinase